MDSERALKFRFGKTDLHCKTVLIRTAFFYDPLILKGRRPPGSSPAYWFLPWSLFE
jgi:hypothetical protein